MNHEYQKHLPKSALPSARLTAKRAYLYAKRYAAPKDVLERLYLAWQELEK
jgi:hypothetical protein